MSDDLKQQRDRFVAFAFAAADLLVEVGPDNRIAFASGAGQQLLGASAAEYVGRPLLELFPVSEHAFVADILCGGGATGRFGPMVVQLHARGHRPSAAILNGCRLPGNDRHLYLTLSAASVAQAVDGLEKRKEAEGGLLTPAEFAEVTAAHIRAAHEIGREVRLTLFDVGGLEEMRAAVGNDPADQFLREVSAALRRRSVGNATARLTDDRYGILHESSLDTEALQATIAGLAQDAAPNAPPVTVRGSTVEANGEIDEREMARALLHTLNTFATEGPEAFSITSMAGAVRSMMGATVQRMTEFKATIAEGRMELRFQPIVDLRTRQPHHYEVLVRFDGDRSPYETIKFAESVHLVHEMDLTICRKVFAEVARDPSGAGPTLAVNLSAQSVQNPAFVRELVALCHEKKALSRRVIFELTESSNVQELGGVDATFQQLRALGYRVCLDDFGAGFASFQYLQALHVDLVKLDGKYIRAVLDSPRDRLMLKAMVGLCRDLSIQTVGEMIETEDQAVAVRDLGVDFGQGWLFGKPMPEIARPAAAPAPASAVASVGMVGRRRGARETWG